MTGKRDESRDVAVLWDWDTLDDGMSTESFPTEVECFDGNELGTSAIRYVIHSQYAELEAENASLKQSLTALEKERDELRERLNERSRLAVEVFHEEDKDGPHVLAEAYLEYRCVKCGELLCPDGSDEALDGLACGDINGHTVQCRKCNAEYVGFTIDTPKLALIQEDL